MSSFKDALNMGVDFMDLRTGYIYKIQEHERSITLGFPVNGIKAVDSLDGSIIGYIEEDEIKKWRIKS